MNTPAPAWVTELQSVITDPEVLCNLLALPRDLVPIAKQVTKQFPLRVTKSFVSRIQKGNLNDPLLKQILPLTLEEKDTVGFSQDPLKEAQHNPVPGLLHKYKGRVLITLTGACAIHCRYCFRRYFPYSQNIPGRKLGILLDYIKKDTSIREVILSGGDPLMMKDQRLAYWLEQLAQIPHLKIIRLHTRLPIVLPARINSALIQTLLHTHLKPILVIHCNHPQEIDSIVEEKLHQLAEAGVTLFNQSVLLKGINDFAEVLGNLSYRLLDCRVIPYYLHILDKVQGAGHFEVERANAQQLYYELRAELPGYLVPLLVEEKPGVGYKIPVI